MDLHLTQKNTRAADGILTLPDADRANVIVLKGDNGEGKTQTASWVRATLGDPRAMPVRREGSDTASLELAMGPHRVTLSLAKIRTSPKGDARIRLGDKSATILTDLIGPIDPVKSTEGPACTDRLKALTEQLGLKMDPEKLAILSDGLECPVNSSGLTFPEVVQAIQKSLAGQARVHQSTADGISGQVTRIETELATLPTFPEGFDPSEAGEAREDRNRDIENARRALYEVEASHRARVQQEEARSKLKTDLPMPTAVSLTTGFQSLATTLVNGDIITWDITDWQNFTRRIEDMRRHSDALRDAVAVYIQTQAALSTPITGATAEDLANAQALVQAAESSRALAEQYFRRACLDVDLAPLKASQKEAIVVAKAYAKASQKDGIWSRVGTILATAGLKHIELNDGELFAQVKGQRIRFADASFGERTLIAAQAVAATVLVDMDVQFTLIYLPGMYWDALGDAFRGEVDAALAECHGFVKILTEETTAGPLAIEAWK